ncbi:hypothetical protein OsI_35114 [Oryza sativa Indica Group]|uniref:Uncharacterized protein n=1 Tax=Oryza sativa subsp. indica TaxID=39946 RepID=B8BJ43_ORYSI|nr:hypothetical protein OsI_35114 [Oryza sativa Indica Group]
MDVGAGIGGNDGGKEMAAKRAGAASLQPLGEALVVEPMPVRARDRAQLVAHLELRDADHAPRRIRAAPRRLAAAARFLVLALPEAAGIRRRHPGGGHGDMALGAACQEDDAEVAIVDRRRHRRRRAGGREALQPGREDVEVVGGRAREARAGRGEAVGVGAAGELELLVPERRRHGGVLVRRLEEAAGISFAGGASIRSSR